MTSTPIFILLTIIVALTIMLVVFFLYLLIKKVVDNRKRRKQSQLNKRILSGLIGSSGGGKGSFQSMAGETAFLSAATDALREFNRNVEASQNGPAMEDLRNVMTPVLLQELKKTKASDRVNALQIIERFFGQFDLDALWSHYGVAGVTEEEQQLILKIAIRNADRRAEEMIKSDSENYSFYTNKQLVRRFHPDRLSIAYDTFGEWPEAFQLALVSFIAEKRLLVQLPLAEQLLDADHTEMKIQAIKCIKEIGYTTVPEKLYAFAVSGDWREQLLFAQTAQVIRQESFIPLLKPLLESSNWQVRYNAGQALVAFEVGLASLREIVATTSDAYARDMAVQWLERKGEILA